MTVSISYPQTVELEDGTMVQMAEDSWRSRQLVVETDKSESDVRDIFAREGFRKAGMEFTKKGQLGRGVVKRIGDWQIHFRFYRHGDRIQLDGEVEVSSEYIEHLTYRWIPALKEGMSIILHYFGTLWIYHNKSQKYVKKIIEESILQLPEPKTKTDLGTGLKIGSMLVAGWLISRALRRRQ